MAVNFHQRDVLTFAAVRLALRALDHQELVATRCGGAADRACGVGKLRQGRAAQHVHPRSDRRGDACARKQQERHER